jgi:hypothetical protein
MYAYPTENMQQLVYSVPVRSSDMRRSVRYIISTIVGIAVTIAVSMFAQGESSHSLVILSLPVVYGVVTSLLLAHKQQYIELHSSQQRASGSKLGGIGGGTGALVGSLLLQVSIPVGVAGFGLMLLGMAVTVASVDLYSPSRSHIEDT